MPSADGPRGPRRPARPGAGGGDRRRGGNAGETRGERPRQAGFGKSAGPATGEMSDKERTPSRKAPPRYSRDEARPAQGERARRAGPDGAGAPSPQRGESDRERAPSRKAPQRFRRDEAGTPADRPRRSVSEPSKASTTSGGPTDRDRAPSRKAPPRFGRDQVIERQGRRAARGAHRGAAGPAPQARAVGPDGEPREGERIAKLLARAGVASRRDIERMIEQGRIALDGVVLTTPATLLTSLRGITVDGEPVRDPSPAQLFMFHKPSGYLTAAHDPQGRPTIYDRLPPDLPRVIPVGRLDLNTEGLLLLTTDGGLKRQLELPATGIERSYRARTYGTVSQAQLEELIDGIEIDGMRYGKIDANLERRTGRNQWIEMTLTEGKNREVRRVLEHLGLEVSRLIRVRYGPFELADMAPGEVREVRRADLVAFRNTLK